MKQSVECRFAHIQDQSTLVQFQLSLALESENLKLDQVTCSKGVAAVFQNPHLGKYFVAELEGQVVGSLLVIPEWSDWRNGMVWWIHSVYVSRDARRHGVFASLYEKVKQWGSEQGDFRGIRLYVDKTNTSAQAVYRRMGMSNHHYELYEWMNHA